jgi:hypothetical protein
VRQMGRSPGFAVTATLMLALGIGASTTIFGFVDAALVQPLPYAQPNRLVDVAKSETGIPAVEYLAVANSIFSSMLNLSSKNGGERGPKLTIRRNQRILRVGLTCSLLDISLFFDFLLTCWRREWDSNPR